MKPSRRFREALYGHEYAERIRQRDGEKDNETMARGNSKKETTGVGAGSNGRLGKIKPSVSEQADWETVDGAILQKAIGHVTAIGGALRFGYTSDGGAYALGVYLGDERITEYFRALNEVEAYLEQLTTVA